ncbi:nucleotidyl transferase AbiEii/AbiGii toxin family protein [Patescibacteria group bacterium]|nr:nucleotidyl transferase AbiEii/AbiGii toxin family protein [Patescibacteria group bacterium]
MLHTNILASEQLDLIELIREFEKDYYLVGGTALALQLGHRRSIDFDLFTIESFNNNKILKIIEKYYPIEVTYLNQKDQLTVVAHSVKLTWYKYEYQVPVTEYWNNVISMPDMLTIACMKAFAIGQRAKWKDYVDMYFLLQRFSLKEISDKTMKLFGKGLFDEVLLRGQLSYFEDVNYQEEVEYMPGFKVLNEDIKKNLMNIASTE